jgi:hypothetical protein
MIDSSLEAVATQAEWVPHTFDTEGSRLTSFFVPREEHRSQPFLWNPELNFREATHLASGLRAHLPPDGGGTPHFIFHTAFCCSTLLVRACAEARGAIGLNEPAILNNLAHRMAAENGSANRARLDLVLSLLGRSFDPGGSVIVKPTNFANALIDPILGMRPKAKAVLLYSNLETMLYSVARRGALGRVWGRQLYDAYAGFSRLDFGFSAAESFLQTDLQIAGLGWLMEVHHLEQVARAHPDRTLMLQADDLLADPGTVLDRVYRFFHLGHQPDRIASAVDGPIFSTHSKDRRVQYNRGLREQERERVLALHAEEVRMVAGWIDAIARHVGIRLGAFEPAFA